LGGLDDSAGCDHAPVSSVDVAQAALRRHDLKPQAVRSVNRFSTWLWLVIGAGTVVRLVVAFVTAGAGYDLQSLEQVETALRHSVFLVYHQLDNFSGLPYGRWPYPPAFFIVIAPIGSVAAHTGIAFVHLIRVPSILADAAIAWVVQDFLGRQGHSERQRLAAAALVAFGPSFAAISAYQGQIDSFAILPAVLAVAVWTRTDADWRPYAAGALIGTSAAIKTVPLLMVLALLPTARSWREGLALTLTATLIPLAVFAPWLILDGQGKSLVWRYKGGAGLGGISLLTNPSLPLIRFSNAQGAVLTGATKVVFDGARWITGAAVVLLAGVVLRRRVAAVQASVLLWLAVWAFGVTFFLQYLVWGLPFLIMAGYLRPVLMLQAWLLPAEIISYLTDLPPWVTWTFYTVPMIIAWAGFTTALVGLTGREARRRSTASTPR
jgi:hypothetical protein